MDTQLSLESIKACLLMEKPAKCTEILLDSNLESFLGREQEKQQSIVDSIFQKLEEAKKSIEKLNRKIAGKQAEYKVAQDRIKRAEKQLAEVSANLVLKEQEYNSAENNAEQASQVHNAQIKEVNNIVDQLTITNKALAKYTYCPCPAKNQLTLQKQMQEQQLAQAKNELNNKVLDKNQKEQVKIQVSAELQTHLEIKNKAENDLTAFNIKQNTIRRVMEEIELEKSQINLEAYVKENDSVKQQVDIINQMLEQLSMQRAAAETKEIIVDVDIQLDQTYVETINVPTPEQDYEYEL